MEAGNSNKKPTYHIILKYSDSGAAPEGTVKSHEKILEKEGEVWLGKFGRKLGRLTAEKLQSQIAKNIPTYLYLVPTGKKHNIVHRLKLSKISKNYNDDLKLVPDYYHDQVKHINSWFKIEKIEKKDVSVLRDLIGYRSNLPILETLRKTMASLIIVKQYN